MRAVQEQLVNRGAWRGGPRTLLAAIGVQYLELPLTTGLAWLLRPDGHHGLGSSLVVSLLDHLCPEAPRTVDASQVRIVREETRADERGETRADLVVYGTDWTLVVEAKTFAVEQPEQLDRLYRLWADEPDPQFVFLTRGNRDQKTAEVSAGRWTPLTWEQVADIASFAATSRAGVAPGVFDYLATLKGYHRV